MPGKTGIQYQRVGRDSLARCPLRKHFPFRVGKPLRGLLRKAFFQGYSNGEITTIPPTSKTGRLMLASRSNNESHNQVPKVESPGERFPIETQPIK